MSGRRPFLIYAAVGSAVAVLTLVRMMAGRVRSLREDVDRQVVDRVLERLENAEKQLLQTYTRRTTRENLHRAIVHVGGWDYHGNADGLTVKLFVGRDMLNLFMQSDADGKVAYMECRSIIDECIDLVGECRSRPTAFEDFIDDPFHRGDGDGGGLARACSERLDREDYELDDVALESALRPIYPRWMNGWLPSEMLRRRVEGILDDDGPTVPDRRDDR